MEFILMDFIIVESMTVTLAIILALMAGLAIPAGAWVSSVPTLRNLCRANDIDSFVSYFGGGALLSAIALVMVPHGMEHITVVPAFLAFLFGGLIFWQVDVRLKRSGSAASQFIGMLLDFIPEAILLGTAAAIDSPIIYLLAAMIALQNMPQGFASYLDMRSEERSNRKLWMFFLIVPLAGPLAAWLGFFQFAEHPGLTGQLILFCSGGILTSFSTASLPAPT